MKIAALWTSPLSTLGGSLTFRNLSNRGSNYAVDNAIVQQRLAAREAAKYPFSGWMSSLTAPNQWVCSPWSLEGSALLGTGTARSQPFVIESYQAALNDATKRFSTVSMEEAAFVQGFTSNYADEIDAGAAYLETGANNFLARFGITEGASYSAGQAYNAVMEVDNNTLAAWQESKPVTYGMFNLAGDIANPVNRAGGGWAGRATSLRGLTFRGAAFGGATGAVYGFGSGDVAPWV